MSDLLETLKARRQVPRSALRLRVRRVVVILSGSRGGSSLFKDILAGHPRITSLDGELEPLLALSGNGFGLNSDSDRIGRVDNADELASGILDELSFASTRIMDTASLLRRWRNRLLLQFPSRFADAGACHRLEQSLQETLGRLGPEDPRSDSELQRCILSAVFSDEPWRISYYDGLAAPQADRYFDEPLKIEEPPFVAPALRRRPLTEAEVQDAVLLFKSPSDAYRIGLYEQLFPNAELSYLHLTRGFAQSVNGLMDGWLYPLGFFSHDLGRIGCELAIPGYSDTVPFGRRWWKFDLPPNWRRFTGARLEDVCLNQWCSIHQGILHSGVGALRVAFEDFIANPATVAERITGRLGLGPLVLPNALPVRMATEPPRAARWRRRGALLLELGARPEVRETMGRLGYAMEPGTWL
ncbi:hypothetical protein [Pelomonas sp. KK5]|uniref:hypothetical protein n=1 Tax=Pelomonas sp. KK5 TaxID=1855730 RepID=UPI00097C6F30|nr:hypothetical protein [Pelomonas sp. KK5]